MLEKRNSVTDICAGSLFNMIKFEDYKNNFNCIYVVIAELIDSITLINTNRRFYEGSIVSCLHILHSLLNENDYSNIRKEVDSLIKFSEYVSLFCK